MRLARSEKAARCAPYGAATTAKSNGRETTLLSACQAGVEWLCGHASCLSARRGRAGRYVSLSSIWRLACGLANSVRSNGEALMLQIVGGSFSHHMAQASNAGINSMRALYCARCAA